MQNFQAGQMADLHTAAFAVGQDNLRFQTINGLCQILSDLLRDLIFLFFETKSSTQATTVRFDIINLRPGMSRRISRAGRPMPRDLR